MKEFNLNMLIHKQEDHGFFDTIIGLWKNIYPYLEIASTIGGCAGFIEFIKNIFKKKTPNPHNFAEYIYWQNKWSHIILANELEISKDEAKTLLKLFGYTWNNSEKLYCITQEEKEEKINKINNISVFGKEK